MYIENIHGPADVKKLDAAARKELAQEMRDALLKRASIHGGHFGPVFGMVEAIIALHTVFDSPKDKIVFDVSHQSYAHKMLTGRKDAYLYEEHYNDVSGYTNPDESEHDFFNIGHTSTSVSLASGLARARDLAGGKENIIAVIGDGSMSGGEALEGLDFVGEQGTNLIIVFNDNDMSIAEVHGGMYQGFRKLRETEGKAEDNLFKAMGLDYRFVKDSNDAEALIQAFSEVKDIDHPVVVHIVTQKGKGYAPAEQNKEDWHWHLPFDIETGEAKMDFTDPYAEMTATHLMEKMKEDPTLAVITSATPPVLGFTKERRETVGKQFIDVGIAEEHAVALASGMAKNGARPVYGVFSTFLQRAYDQISQDVCINNNPVVFVVGWASMNGMNDVTHLGIFDIPMLSNIPNLVYLSPTSSEEYLAMLDWAIEQREHLVAIRMPNPAVGSSSRKVRKSYAELNRYEITHQGAKVAILGLGNFYGLAEEAAAELKEKTGIDATLVNPIFITGQDEELLNELKREHSVVVTLEDGVLDGGFGEKIARFYGTSDMRVLNFGLKKDFYDRYDPAVLMEANHLTAKQIAEDVCKVLG